MTCSGLFESLGRQDDIAYQLHYLACEGSNRVRNFLSAQTVNKSTVEIPQALVVPTLVLNSVQEGGDEFRLDDYGGIEVLPYR